MKLALHWQILIALLLGGLAGWVGGDESQWFGIRLISVYDFVGTLFLNGLKMLIVPLIASSIIVGVAGIGSSANLGRLGGKTLGFYVLTTLSAILVGLILVNLVRPGELNGQPVQELLALESNGSEIADAVAVLLVPELFDQSFFVDVREHHICALVGKVAANRQPDAIGPARDDDGLA